MRMIAKLEKPLRRQVTIDREPWIVTLSVDGLKLARKRKRKGLELRWKDLVRGDAALAVALNTSMRAAGPLRRSARS